MAKHRIQSIEFKRQVGQEFLAGETLHGLAKRYDLLRNLVRIWVQKFEGRSPGQGASVRQLQIALRTLQGRSKAFVDTENDRLDGRVDIETDHIGSCAAGPQPRQGRNRQSAAASLLTMRG